MWCIGRSAIFLSATLLVTGCGNSQDLGSGDEVANPKYPDLFVTIVGPLGHDGGLYWYEQDEGDGYTTYSTARSAQTKGETEVRVKPRYDGATDTGDKYVFEVTVGDTADTKEVIYRGERLEVALADGVKLVLEPDPLP